MRGQLLASAAPYAQERPGTHCTGGWVGLRAGLDSCGKSRLTPGSDPRTVQSVGSRYTDYATRPTLTWYWSQIYEIMCNVPRNCKGRCPNRRCLCLKSRIMCNSKCHNCLYYCKKQTLQATFTILKNIISDV